MVQIKQSISLARLLEARNEWLDWDEKGAKLARELTGQNCIDLSDIVREIKNRLYEDKIQSKKI